MSNLLYNLSIFLTILAISLLGLVIDCIYIYSIYRKQLKQIEKLKEENTSLQEENTSLQEENALLKGE